MKTLFVLSMALVFTPVLGAQNESLKTIDEIKQWHFDIQHGRVDVKLSSYVHGGRPQNTALSLSLAGTDSAATVSEEADLLRKVFGEMPSLGYAPRNLQMISARLDESELRAGMNLAVAKSGEWQTCIGRKYCYEAQKVANQFLKSSNAYWQLDGVLRSYGLKRKGVSVDDMACGTASGSGPMPQSDAGESKVVSCGGSILIELEKAEVAKPGAPH